MGAGPLNLAGRNISCTSCRCHTGRDRFGRRANRCFESSGRWGAPGGCRSHSNTGNVEFRAPDLRSRCCILAIWRWRCWWRASISGVHSRSRTMAMAIAGPANSCSAPWSPEAVSLWMTSMLWSENRLQRDEQSQTRMSESVSDSSKARIAVSDSGCLRLPRTAVVKRR